MLAQATAQASGLAMKVGPCMKAPGGVPEIVAADPSVVVSTAARVR